MCGLVHDAINSTADIIANPKTIKTITNWKESGRRRSWPNLRYYATICSEELREAIKGMARKAVLRTKV
jgi:hypothetical protein